MALRHTKKAPKNFGAFFDLTNRHDKPLLKMTLRPNRSLPRQGLAWLLLILWGFLLLPLLVLLGGPALWVMLPFSLLPVVAIWYFIERSYKDGTLREELRLWPDLIAVERHNPRAEPQFWYANPYWTRLNILAGDGPVEDYVTLTGNDRTIELGAFLSPQQRVEAHASLSRSLGNLGEFTSPNR